MHVATILQAMGYSHAKAYKPLLYMNRKLKKYVFFNYVKNRTHLLTSDEPGIACFLAIHSHSIQESFSMFACDYLIPLD